MKDILNKINENTYVISDHHFGHNKVNIFEQNIRGSNRIETEKMMIAYHNKIIKKDDNVLFLGDFAFKNIQHYIQQLSGNKILILGNHDRKGKEVYKSDSLTVIRGLIIDYNNYYLKYENSDPLLSGVIKLINNKEVLFSHYPVFSEREYESEKILERKKIFEDFYNDFCCDINIHGHLHSKTSSFADAINVSAEQTGLKPVKIGDLL